MEIPIPTALFPFPYFYSHSHSRSHDIVTVTPFLWEFHATHGIPIVPIPMRISTTTAAAVDAANNNDNEIKMITLRDNS